VIDPEAGTPHVQLHASNPSKLTLRRRAACLLLAASRAHKQVLESSPCPDNPLKVTIRGAPVTNQHLSSPLEIESSPAELDADAAADTSSSPSPSASPVSSIHCAFSSESPSPMANVEALIAMGTSPESPKATPPVNRSQRPALANPTNKLAPQVTLFCNRCVLALHCLVCLHVCVVPPISLLSMPLFPSPIPCQPLFPTLIAIMMQ